ncbi:MAG: hypothetical protein HC890_07835 [Chloroflexaceae bacterium]|nr:hypothetical protein [Chloroflexaceae bacterium]
MIAATIGLGIGLLSGSVDWEKVKNNTEELTAVIAGLGLVSGGAIAAFCVTPPKKSDVSSKEEK